MSLAEGSARGGPREQVGRVTALECVRCGRSYRQDEVLYTCPSCGPAGILDVVYDYEALEASGFGPERLAANPDRTHWRYLDLLPITSGAALPPVPVGGTPLFQLPDLAERLGVGEMWIKDEGRNPSGSFKDRASSVAAVKARQLGFQTVCCASTGNAASSLAGFSAQLGLDFSKVSDRQKQQPGNPHHECPSTEPAQERQQWPARRPELALS